MSSGFVDAAPVPIASSSHRPAAEGKAGRPDGRRPALDGLRALAVTSVMVYHFGGGSTAWLPGGFLGVDVFFVLSGYLISGLLLREFARSGRIDLLGFWARRARRLIPALVLMLLGVCAWVWWAAPLESYPARRSDVFWTLGYLANWHLINGPDGYFTAYTVASPLRHTWSLAIEEQFYLVWPLLIIALLWLGGRVSRRLNGRYRMLLVVLAAGIGALLSVREMAGSYVSDGSSTAYYQTQDRVQELFVGVLLAVFVSYWRVGPNAVIRRLVRGLSRNGTVLGGVALAGLLTAFALMSDAAPFYYRGGALLVCVLVAIVIAVFESRPAGPLARLFSWRPAVALGRISYGVYLWHWPLVLMIPVLASQSIGDQIGRQAERLILALLLAGLSFRFVEQPVQRDRRWLKSKRWVLTAVLASSALVAGLAVPATALPGTLAEQITPQSDRACPGGERVDFLISCTAPQGADATTSRPALALLGDSTARALGTGLDDWARSTGNTWIEAAWRRCTPTGLIVLPTYGLEPDLSAKTCSQQSPGLIRKELSTYRPPVVMIAETWSAEHALLVGGTRLEPGTQAHDAAVVSAYVRLVDEIGEFGGRAVFVELPPVGDTIGAQLAAGRPAGKHRPESNDRKISNRYNTVLRRVAAQRPGHADVVSVTDLICPANRCPAVVNGVLVRADGTHYTTEFSRRLVPVLLRRSGVAGR